MTTDKITKKFNEQRYQALDLRRMTVADELRIQKVLGLIGSGKTVLDVGCFDGTISEKILKNGNDVYGLDISEPAIEAALKKEIKAQVANVEERWPFADNFFDGVFAGEIIEHLFDTDGFLGEVKRVLKPDGFLVLTTPNLASLGRRLLLLTGKNPLIESACLNAVAGHLRYFVKDSLFELLHRHSFVVVKFESTVVNFNITGNFCSRFLAKVFPSLGSSLIVKCQVGK